MKSIVVQVTDIEVLDAMEAMGGSFAKMLAKLTRLADFNNKARIYRTWPELFKEYQAHAQRKVDAEAAND